MANRSARSKNSALKTSALKTSALKTGASRMRGPSVKKVKLDPVDYAVISQGLIAAAKEMGTKLVRSSYSTIVREAQDASAALFDRHGNVIAQAELIPMQLGPMSEIFRACAAVYPPETLKDGDFYINNDPYGGGQHLRMSSSSRRSSSRGVSSASRARRHIISISAAAIRVSRPMRWTSMPRASSFRPRSTIMIAIGRADRSNASLPPMSVFRHRPLAISMPSSRPMRLAPNASGSSAGNTVPPS
jgi:hypothetical protein